MITLDIVLGSIGALSAVILLWWSRNIENQVMQGVVGAAATGILLAALVIFFDSGPMVFVYGGLGAGIAAIFYARKSR
ncbi:MAG: hypothetical protein OXH94_16905 [Rhodospirillales bacterium]|nr:hypothetical protein [Rhodospirillales bacterium]